MTATTRPALSLFFLIALGSLAGQSPVRAEDEVPESAARGGPESTSDIEVMISRNSLELARLGHLFKNLLDFVSGTPCLETALNNEVSGALADGFKESAEYIKAVQHTVRNLKLFMWRVKFAKSLHIPKMDRDSRCPLPFYMLDGECIFLDTKVKRSFATSKLSCILMGGYLAEPAKPNEFRNHVTNMLKNKNYEVWVGGQAASKDEPWKWMNSEETINEIDWDTDESDPQFGDIGENEKACLATKKTGYIGVPCLRRKMFACEVDVPPESES